jgi:hypothetical protein
LGHGGTVTDGGGGTQVAVFEPGEVADAGTPDGLGVARVESGTFEVGVMVERHAVGGVGVSVEEGRREEHEEVDQESDGG